MSPGDFNKAMSIAHEYFDRRGIQDRGLLQPLGRYAFDLYRKGETRPLMLANRAINRMERHFEAEFQIRSEQMLAVFQQL